MAQRANYDKLVLSLRLPPTVKADSAAQQLKAILETDPPYARA
jgi:hypothetical protein